MTPPYIHIIWLLLLLSGCAQQATQAITNNTRTAEKSVIANMQTPSNLLLFSEAFVQLPAESQKKLLIEINQLVSAPNALLIDKLKLATMLTLPNSHVKDLNKAQALLHELSQSTGINRVDLAYIGLMQEWNISQLKTQQKIKEEAKTTDHLAQKYEALDQKNEVLTQKYEALQKKYEALEQKLTDLKNIEKSLSERDIKSLDKTQP